MNNLLLHEKLIGTSVSWTSNGEDYAGAIIGVHVRTDLALALIMDSDGYIYDIGFNRIKVTVPERLGYVNPT